MEQILDGQHVRQDNSIELYSVEVLKRFAMAGAGVTILPKVAVTEEVAQKSLAILPGRKTESKWPF